MQIALSEKFNAVGADTVMPDLAGYNMFRVLSQNPSYKNTPIIIKCDLGMMRKPAQSKGVKTQRKTSLFRAGFCISRTVLRNAISELEQEITANTEESFADTYFVKGGGLKKTLLENLAKFIAEKS